MRSSDKAFGILALKKRLITKRELRKAEQVVKQRAATGNPVPLETVLKDEGLIDDEGVKRIVMTRARHGRGCRECGEVTFLLPGQRSEELRCEFCEGDLIAGRLDRPRSSERRSRWRTAMRSYRDQLRLVVRSQSAELWLSAAKQAEGLGRFDDAEVLLTKLLEFVPGHAYARTKLGKLQMRGEREDFEISEDSLQGISLAVDAELRDEDPELLAEPYRGGQNAASAGDGFSDQPTLEVESPRQGEGGQPGDADELEAGSGSDQFASHAGSGEAPERDAHPVDKEFARQLKEARQLIEEEPGLAPDGAPVGERMERQDEFKMWAGDAPEPSSTPLKAKPLRRESAGYDGYDGFDDEPVGQVVGAPVGTPTPGPAKGKAADDDARFRPPGAAKGKATDDDARFRPPGAAKGKATDDDARFRPPGAAKGQVADDDARFRPPGAPAPSDDVHFAPPGNRTLIPPFRLDIGASLIRPFCPQGFAIIVLGALILGLFSLFGNFSMFLKAFPVLYLMAYYVSVIEASSRGDLNIPSWPDISKLPSGLRILFVQLICIVAPAFLVFLILAGGGGSIVESQLKGSMQRMVEGPVPKGRTLADVSFYNVQGEEVPLRKFAGSRVVLFISSVWGNRGAVVVPEQGLYQEALAAKAAHANLTYLYAVNDPSLETDTEGLEMQVLFPSPDTKRFPQPFQRSWASSVVFIDTKGVVTRSLFVDLNDAEFLDKFKAALATHDGGGSSFGSGAASATWGMLKLLQFVGAVLIVFIFAMLYYPMAALMAVHFNTTLMAFRFPAVIRSILSISSDYMRFIALWIALVILDFSAGWLLNLTLNVGLASTLPPGFLKMLVGVLLTTFLSWGLRIYILLVSGQLLGRLYYHNQAALDWF